MSILVPFDSIDAAKNQAIKKYCVVVESVKVPGSRFPRKEQHNFYSVKYNAQNKPSHVALPHYTGRTIMQCGPNNVVATWSEDKFTGKLRQDQQEDMIKAVEILKRYGSAVLQLPTGYGKTVIATYLPSVLRMKTLFTTIRVSLLESMRKTIADFSSLRSYTISGEINEQEFQNADIILCGRENLTKLSEDQKSKIGILILDEAHSFCTKKSMDYFLTIHPRYVIAMSATPDRASGMGSMLDVMCGPHRVVRELSASFRVVRAKTGVTIPTIKRPDGKADWAALQKSVMSNSVINEKIINYILQNKDKKILVLAWNKQHINVLYKMLLEKGETVDYMTGTKQSYKNGRILLGTISKISTGFDEKNTCVDFDNTRLNMLILLGSTKDISLLTQMSGRVFRSADSVIVDVVHNNPILSGHWYIRKKWYDQRAGIVETIEL